MFAIILAIKKEKQTTKQKIKMSIRNEFLPTTATKQPKKNNKKFKNTPTELSNMNINKQQRLLVTKPSLLE